MQYAEIALADGVLFDTEPAPQCCAWETLESRIGACDGGERCRNKAIKTVDGVPYCHKHGVGQ